MRGCSVVWLSFQLGEFSGKLVTRVRTNGYAQLLAKLARRSGIKPDTLAMLARNGRHWIKNSSPPHEFAIRSKGPPSPFFIISLK